MNFQPQTVLDFWFPTDLDIFNPEAMGQFWFSRMQGGMDEAICRDHEEITFAAARGELDHWADTWDGRLALILVLDQFPRSLWRDTPGAYAQDIKAARLSLEGLQNGHYDAIDPQDTHKRAFYTISINHCEGPDHLERMDMLVELAEREVANAVEARKEMVQGQVDQVRRVREVIRRFGRHPHRNPILGRLSTPEEEAYIATGDFPHVKQADD